MIVKLLEKVEILQLLSAEELRAFNKQELDFLIHVYFYQYFPINKFILWDKFY